MTFTSMTVTNATVTSATVSNITVTNISGTNMSVTISTVTAMTVTNITDTNLTALDYTTGRAAVVLWQVLSPLLIVFGTVGNVLTILVLRRKEVGYMTSTPYLATLAVVDIAVLYTGLLRQWVRLTFDVDIRALSDTSCKLHIFSVYYTLDVSVWLLVAVTVERFVSVCFPFAARTIKFTYRIVTIAAIFVVLFLLNLHFFVGYEVVGSHVDGHVTYSCTHPVEDYEHFIDYSWPWIDFTVFCFAPFTAIVVCNISILVKLYLSHRSTHTRVAPQSASIRSNSRRQSQPDSTPIVNVTDNKCLSERSRSNMAYPTPSTHNTHLTVRSDTKRLSDINNKLNVMDDTQDMDNIDSTRTSIPLNNMSNARVTFSSPSPTEQHTSIQPHLVSVTQPQTLDQHNRTPTNTNEHTQQRSTIHRTNPITPSIKHHQSNERSASAMSNTIQPTTTITPSIAPRSTSAMSNRSIRPTAAEQPSQKRAKRTSSNMTVLLLTLNTVFLITTAPISIFLIYEPYWLTQHDPQQKANYDLVYMFVNIISYANNAINFVLYCTTGPRFRAGLKGMLGLGEARESATELPTSSEWPNRHNASVRR